MTTIIKPWTNLHIKKYEWLYNHLVAKYKNIDHETYIINYKNSLKDIINKNIEWSDSSKESLFFMIARYFNNIQNVKYYEIYSKLGYNLMMKTRQKDEKNELDENERENFRTHDFFINILKNIDYDKINTIEGHYKYLLLNLLVNQAPIRTSFYNTAKIIKSKIDDDKINNFVLINRRGQLKISYIINNDKVSNTKTYLNKKLNKIDIDDELLTKLLNDSYIKYPRLYLFELNNKPISQNTLLRWLRDVTGVAGLNFDIMRASFITWFYEHNLTFGKRETLSKMMRHSQLTAQKNYNKVFETENNNIINTDNLNKEIVELKFKITELENKLLLYEDNQADQKQIKKKKQDVIYNLNIKNRKPREETLKKYNILYDDNTLKYY